MRWPRRHRCDGAVSLAYTINLSARVVGWPLTGGDLYHAFFDPNGVMTDLNTSISPSSGWTLQSASAINDLGRILGSGIGPDGKPANFPLTPVSEPPPVAPRIPESSTLASFGLVAVGVALRRVWPRR